MKAKLLTAALIAIGISINPHFGYAENACVETACPSDKIPPVTSMKGCEGNFTWLCYTDSQGKFLGPFQTCLGNCATGYTNRYSQAWIQAFETNGGCNTNNHLTAYVYECVSNAELCGTCDSSAWTEIPGIPYATRTYKWCDGTTCKSKSQVGCKIGYYGTPASIGSGCTQCPVIPGTNNVYGKTGAIGAQDVTECYIPAETPLCDTTGCGKYKYTCYATK